MKDLLNFSESNFEIHDFLPKYDYNKEPSREWFCNLINTQITDKFKEFINVEIKWRNKELITKQNLGICVIPEFNEIFRNSQSIATFERQVSLFS